MTPPTVRRPSRSASSARRRSPRRPADTARTTRWPDALADLRSTRLHRAGRRALRTRSLAIVLAVGAGLLTHGQWIRGQQLRNDWGSRRIVLVAARDLSPGDPLDTSSIRTAEVPTSAVPGRAVERVEPGRRAVRSVTIGEILVEDDVAPAASGPLAARLPAGHTGVAVVLADDAPAIGPGDVVDVVAAPEPFVDDAGSGEATVVARSAVVIDIRDDSVTLAVADDEATRVAQRALVGPVGLTVRRPVTGP